MVMGETLGPSALTVANIITLFISLFPPASPECQILKCNSEFWASAAALSPGVEFCLALRAYHVCVRRTALGCRGDLTYHSAQLGIKDLMGQHNCSEEGIAPWTMAPPTFLSPDNQEHLDRPDICPYDRRHQFSAPPPNFTHCGFFGDPHLHTFNNDFHTCKVEGAWPLIHNKYLSVQVTNTPVLPGASATATSKLTIIFKSFHECMEQKMYHAETDELPAAFADGSRSVGEGHAGSSLHVVEKVPGQLVEIHAQYLSTTIVLRQVGRHLTFTVRMPEPLVSSPEETREEDLYLCRDGCPRSQRIDVALANGGRSLVHAGRFTYNSAVAACKQRLPVDDLYFQSCIFDLLMSGDVSFAMAAFHALEDAKTLQWDRSKHHVLQRAWRAGSSAAESSSLLSILLAFLVLWVQGCSLSL